MAGAMHRCQADAATNKHKHAQAVQKVSALARGSNIDATQRGAHQGALSGGISVDGIAIHERRSAAAWVAHVGRDLLAGAAKPRLPALPLADAAGEGVAGHACGACPAGAALPAVGHRVTLQAWEKESQADTAAALCHTEEHPEHAKDVCWLRQVPRARSG